MNGTLPLPTQRPRKPLVRAFSLVEVMVAAGMFAITSTALTALFLQNLRFSKWQVDNVQVTNTSFGFLDQIKNKGANAMYSTYQATTAGTPQTITVTCVDPSDPKDGYQDLNLKINAKDGAEVDKVWTNTYLKLGSLPTSPSIPVSYWVSIKRNVNAPNTTPVRDVLEVTVICSWTVGTSHRTLNQMQIAFPAPNGSFN
jgi:type II secretory pathway pseudopilin PulG